jgi:hypothetical protein
MTTDRKVDGWVSELVGAICDPVIVFPAGGWEKDLPDWIFSQIKLERLVMNMKVMKEGGVPVGDTEVLAYMMPRTMESPMNEQWGRIYMYVFNQAMKFKKVEVPEDLKQEPLTDYDMRQLNDLKLWIYERRVKHRKEKERGERAAALPVKEEEKELVTVAEQTAFF